MNIIKFNEGLFDKKEKDIVVESIHEFYNSCQNDYVFLSTLLNFSKNKTVHINDKFFRINDVYLKLILKGKEVVRHLVFVTITGEDVYMVGNKIIFKPINRIISKDDPFGEEIWD